MPTADEVLREVRESNPPNVHELTMRLATRCANAENRLAEVERAALDGSGRWEEEARRYAGNADYWRERAEQAVRERDIVERLRALPVLPSEVSRLEVRKLMVQAADEIERLRQREGWWQHLWGMCFGYKRWDGEHIKELRRRLGIGS